MRRPSRSARSSCRATSGSMPRPSAPTSRPEPGGRLDAFEIDEGVKALYATGLFQDVRPSIAGRPADHHRRRKPGDQPHRLRGQQARSRTSSSRPEIQSKERGTLVAPGGAGRRAAHRRRLPAQRPLRHPRRAQDHRAAEQPRRPRVRDQRGRQDRRQEHRLRRQSRLFVVPAQGRHQDLADRPAGFLQTTDIYDPDRIEADRELLRRFYLKHGYIDVRIVSAVGEFDPARRGFVVTFTIEEGEQYRVGTVDVQSTVRAIDPALLRRKLRVFAGDVYNAEAVEKSVEEMTIEAAKRGYAFATVRPRGDRNFAEPGRSTSSSSIEEGARVYIERINIRGNTRTRDYVIRREFDIAEGDAYNRALVNRAERRLEEPELLQEREDHHRARLGARPRHPQCRPRREVDRRVLGRRRLFDRRRLHGRGQRRRAQPARPRTLRQGVACNTASMRAACELSFVEPYFLGYRVALGSRLVLQAELRPITFLRIPRDDGWRTRLGFALREDLACSCATRSTSRRSMLAAACTNCNNINPDFINTFPTPAALNSSPATRDSRRTTLPRLDQLLCRRRSLARGQRRAGAAARSSRRWSAIRSRYNTLDNNKNPTSGLLAELRAGFRRRRRRRATSSAPPAICATITSSIPTSSACCACRAATSSAGAAEDLRMLDHFQMGPNLVRGFAPAGIGPRDLTSSVHRHFGTRSAAPCTGAPPWKVQTPIYFLPKDVGIKVAAFADAGSLWNYVGPTSFPATGECCQARLSMIRTVSGRQRHACASHRSASASFGSRRSDRSGSIIPSR